MSEEKRLATEEHLDSRIMEFLKPRMGARFKTWMNICAHCSLCSDTCHFYLSSGKEPKMVPSYKIRFLKDMLRKKGKVDKAYLQEV